MKILLIDPFNPSIKILKKAVKVLKGSGVLIYPTDTVYGIGCILEEEPVRRVYDIKKRGMDKPLSVAFSDLDMVCEYAIVTDDQKTAFDVEDNQPFTYILRKKGNIPDFVACGLDTVGVRIPPNRVCKNLISMLGEPIISTSVNLSGEPAPDNIDKIDESILNKVDLILDAGQCSIGTPSSVIDLTCNGKVLR